MKAALGMLAIALILGHSQAQAAFCAVKDYAQLKDQAAASENARDQLVLQYCLASLSASSALSSVRDAGQCAAEADKILTALRAVGDAPRADGAPARCAKFAHK